MTEPTAEAASLPLRFVTLGPLQVLRDSQALELGGRQQRAVLAVLLVNRPAVVSVSRLADEIWGESVPAGHVRTIQTYVHHLREALKAMGQPATGVTSVIGTVPGGYQLLAEPEAIDAVLFERGVDTASDLLRAGDPSAARREYVRALELWQGEPLADLGDMPVAASYGRRLEDVRLLAVAGLIESRMALGEHADVLPELRELVSQYPLREKFHAQYMLALYRSGRQADALSSYGALRQLLDDELGVEPSPEVRQLHHAMLVQDPELVAPPIRSPEHRPPTAPPPSDEPSEPALEPAPRTWRRRRSLAAAVVALLVVTGGAVAFGAWHQPIRSLSELPPNSLARIAPDGTLHDAIDLGLSPTAVAYGAGSLWVTGGTTGRVLRVDPKSHQRIGSIAVGHSPTSLAVTGRDVWVTNSRDGTVGRINAETDSVAQTVTVGALPAALAAGPNGVWVANSGDDSIQRIDPKTGAAGAATNVGSRPDGIAVTPTAVWVANADDGSVTATDPRTGQDLRAPIPVGTSPGAIAVVGSSVWVADTDSQSVNRIDAAGDSPVRQLPVGEGPVSLASAGGHLLVGNTYDGTVTVIDPAGVRTLRHFAVGAPPRGMVAVGSSVWVITGAVAPSATAHKGGTLVIAAQYLPGAYAGVDPSLDYEYVAISRMMRLVYDGLVSFRYASATGGVTAVPDLATALPVPTDGRRTYTFTLRRGIRYSDGTFVKAQDIRRSVQRSLMLGNTYAGDQPQAAGIVGADHCGPTYDSCPLAGVVADDTAGTVVFHLVEPNPYFLLELAAFGQAEAPGLPAGRVVTPIPGTGPYVISQFQANEDDSEVAAFTLTRNPYFKPWSYAAQPPGFPDRITYLKTPDEATAVRAVETGKADLFYVQGGRGLTAEQSAAVAEFGREYPAQLQPDGDFAVDWLYLNRHVPPFNDLRVRRAINDAIDRNHLVDLYGGTSLAQPTCQLLPPDLPGYRAHCPYSAGAPDRPYEGPKLQEAVALVNASHTRGMNVTVNSLNGVSSVAMAHYLASVLTSLGYHAHVVSRQQGELFGLPESVMFRLQIVESTGWLADYPAPYNFYSFAMDCAGNYLSCNPEIDKLAAVAHAEDLTNPARARQLWATVDERLTDDAAILPLINQAEVMLTSRRVGNYQSTPLLGPLFSQMWVR